MTTTPAESTVLIVEEEGEAREVVVEHLALHGLAVLEAASGVEAMVLLKRARPAAVVLNLTMPRLGGLEALHRIRALHPSVTVIALADEGDNEVYWRALELGAHDVLPTPVVPADLLASLEAREQPPPGRGDQSLMLEPAEPRSPVAREPRARVLVVDDDPDTRTTLVEFFTARGYRVGATPEDAVAEHAIVQDPPDVVLLDISRAAASEIDTLPTIRTFAPHAAVILTGAVADIEIGRRGFARGAFDFVVKPLDLEALGECVEAAVTLRRLMA